MINHQEYELVLRKCRALQPADGMYLIHDYMTNLFLTVLDFMLQGRIIEKAIAYYKDNRWNEVRTLDDIKHLLSKYEDSKEGNTAIAQYLWNYKYWTRISLLRRLVAYFELIRVTSQESLTDWANTSDFERDFRGRIPGMGFAIYQWLIMRQGIETIKPDVHVRRFIESIIHRSDFTDKEVVVALEKVARQLSLKAYELDWRVWEYQRSK